MVSPFLFLNVFNDAVPKQRRDNDAGQTHEAGK